MKQVVCPAPGCRGRRVHFERQDESRGEQLIAVPDDWNPDKGIAFCSLTCSFMSGLRCARLDDKRGWERFLELHESQGAHFHGEGDPPDLVLELKPTSESQDWLVVCRPPGYPDTDKVREGMCWEMLTLIRNWEDEHGDL